MQTSISLLERLRCSPDEATWSRFVAIYAPLIYHRLRAHGLQDQDARDLGQEVMLAVVREMPEFRYDAQRGQFRSWLREVVCNRLRMFCRKRLQQANPLGKSQFEIELDELADPESEVAKRWNESHDSHVATHILKILQTEFETATWQAFWRVVVDGEKPVAVAASLGLSLNAVYLAKSRIIRRLRQEGAELLTE